MKGQTTISFRDVLPIKKYIFNKKKYSIVLFTLSIAHVLENSFFMLELTFKVEETDWQTSSKRGRIM